MKLTHELFLLMHAVNALEDARLAVRLALRDASANNKRWLLQWAREEADRYAPRLAMWWTQTQQLAAAAQAFSGREVLDGIAAGPHSSSQNSHREGNRFKALHFFFPQRAARWKNGFRKLASKRRSAASLMSSSFIEDSASCCLSKLNAGGAL